MALILTSTDWSKEENHNQYVYYVPMSVCLNELEVIILYVHKIIEYFELSEVIYSYILRIICITNVFHFDFSYSSSDELKLSNNISQFGRLIFNFSNTSLGLVTPGRSSSFKYFNLLSFPRWTMLASVTFPLSLTSSHSNWSLIKLKV